MNKDLKEIFEIIDTLENSVRKLVIENENYSVRVKELAIENAKLNTLNLTKNNTYLCKCRSIYVQLSSLIKCECHKKEVTND